VFLEQGEILEEGPPSQVLLKPRHPRTKDFLRKVL
jgi:polar amino acid transport system ATP-binding protein